MNDFILQKINYHNCYCNLPKIFLWGELREKNLIVTVIPSYNIVYKKNNAL